MTMTMWVLAVMERFEIWEVVVKDRRVADNESVTLDFSHSHAHA